MSVPGSNILRTASRLIKNQIVVYHQWTGRARDGGGIFINSWAPARNIKGSFQPVPRRFYENLGLDFNKTYFNFYTEQKMLDIQRDVSSDKISFNNGRYQVISATPWHDIDGWVAVLCVQIGESEFKDAGL